MGLVVRRLCGARRKEVTHVQDRFQNDGVVAGSSLARRLRRSASGADVEHEEHEEPGDEQDDDGARRLQQSSVEAERDVTQEHTSEAERDVTHEHTSESDGAGTDEQHFVSRAHQPRAGELGEGPDERLCHERATNQPGGGLSYLHGSEQRAFGFSGGKREVELDQLGP